MNSLSLVSRATVRAIAIATFAFLGLCNVSAYAADMCMGPGQVLIPDGNGGAVCLQGYDGYAVSNCQAVPNAMVIEVGTGHLTCTPGPSCPAGYSQNLPPSVGQDPNYMIKPWVCQAVCSPVFVGHGWPCSCPYGQRVDSQTHQCAPACGPSATWQHSSGYAEKSAQYGDYLTADAGVCTCPSGQEYVAGPAACMPPCLSGQFRDGNGTCYTPSGGGTPNLCSNGQKVGVCQCPASGIVHNGRCYICTVQNPSPECVGFTPPPPPDEGGGPHPVLPVKPSCAPGAHWDGEACVANQPPPPPTCGAGTHWNGSQCVANLNVIPVCGAGTHWDGDHCAPNVVITPTHVCARGMHWDGKQCIADGGGPAPAAPVCRRNQHWDGRTCVANGCSAREHWDGQRCVAN